MTVAPQIRRAGVSESLSIAGPAGKLEVELERASPRPAAVAVICHPHPLHQGTMHNKVVTTLARAWSRRGATAVRFNFRGVGNSNGSYDDGRGELEDALTVIDWAAANDPESELYIAGFSFGGAVAFRAAAARKARALVTVAPAVQRIAAEEPRPDCDWLIVQGAEDDVIPLQLVQQWSAGFEPPPTIDIVNGAGHFFHGRLPELKAALNRFLDKG